MMIRSLRPHRLSRKAVTVIALATTLGLGQAAACAFHYYLPEKTAVDWLLDGSDVILARPAVENKFTYETAIVLRGNGPSEPLPFLVDSVMRRKMAANPDDYMLFARENGADWQNISYVSPAYLGVLNHVLAEHNAWEPEYGRARFSLFEALLNHPDSSLRKLALREIDKAPYALLQTADPKIPIADLLAELWTREGYALQSIRILLLGLSDNDDARREVYDFFDRTKAWDSANNLGAFATAFIELDGVEGLSRLDEVLFSDPHQSIAKIEQAIEALAIQNAVAPKPLRDAISGVLMRLIEQRPLIAPLIVRQFEARKDLSQGETVAKVIRNPEITDRADQLAIMRYVTRAAALSE